MSRMRSKAPRRSLRRSEEHTSELQSQSNLVCRLLLEKKKIARCITHPRVGPHPRITFSKLEDQRTRPKLYARHACDKTEATRFQPAHDAAPRVQSQEP